MKILFASTLLILLKSFSYGQKQDTLLLKAYKSNSVNQLEKFFEYWFSQTPPISTTDFKNLNDTIQNTYLVFQNFYDPFEIRKIGGSEWGNNIYKKSKYLITQDRIYYGVVDTLDKDLLIKNELNLYTNGDSTKIAEEQRNYRYDTINFERGFLHWPRAKTYDTLKNFRPKLIFSNAKAITLTKTYDGLLNYFLGDNHLNLGASNIMAPAKSKGESETRQKFLERYIKIWCGHWGGYWQLYSYPYVSKITFDKKFENALVEYVMVYEGGEAYFKKINGNWKLIQARRTWIE